MVKRHCGSMPELAPSPRLPGHKPYGLSPCLEKEEPGKVERRKSQSSTSEGDESLRTPPTTPVHVARSLSISQEEEPGDPVFATPPEENKAPEMPRNSPTTGMRDADGNLQGPLDKLAASPNHPAVVGSPAGTALSSPARPEASGGAVSLFTGSEEESLTGPEPAVPSRRSSSPAMEGEDNITIPPFQFTQLLNVSTYSRGKDFESPGGEITEPYRRYLGQTSMKRSDWTYYQEQDQADPTEYHSSWPTGMRELGPIMIPAGSETQRRIPPLSPTYVGRTLWRKIADLKQQKSWGNVQEQPGILQHMWITDAAIKNDLDWSKTLRRYREDPTEGYLHTVLPTGEVLPFSEAMAIAYEYPCTLGKQQEGLHKRIVLSSTTGIPLITPALSGRLRLQVRRKNAMDLLLQRKDWVGYVGDEVCEEDRPNPDIVSNKWKHPGNHYECHHPECVVIGSARPYFITEEEYLRIGRFSRHRVPLVCLFDRRVRVCCPWNAGCLRLLYDTCATLPCHTRGNRRTGAGKERHHPRLCPLGS